jgi:hypothetical protein
MPSGAAPGGAAVFSIVGRNAGAPALDGIAADECGVCWFGAAGRPLIATHAATPATAMTAIAHSQPPGARGRRPEGINAGSWVNGEHYDADGTGAGERSRRVYGGLPPAACGPHSETCGSSPLQLVGVDIIRPQRWAG